MKDKPGIILRIYAFFSHANIVVLKSGVSSKIYFSIERIDPFGQKYCHVYWFNQIGHVILLPDGKTAGESSYIKQWTYYK